MSGKTTCKEVCSTCKTTIVEKTKDESKNKDKKDCVATIVGVLSFPENFCRQDNTKKDDSCQDNTKKDNSGRRDNTKKDDFCRQDNTKKDDFCRQDSTKKDDFCGSDKDSCFSSKNSTMKNDDNDDKKDSCAEVYRDLGECLQKCIVKTSKNGKQ